MAYIFEYIRNWLGNNFFLQNFRDREGSIFYDLGSGTGKAVLAMALFGPFKKLIGIELLEGLWNLSMRSKKFYEKTITDTFIKYKALFTMEETNSVEFLNGDFLRQNWSDAFIIFANSTCFSQDLMTKIGNKAKAECKVDTIIITVSKKITNLNSDWESKNPFKRLMSWGVGTIYLYLRKKVTINYGDVELTEK